ncbi:helix-turn-helix domain-containing protein [Paenibacillus chondroitinus]|uniref:Helix-turn-helix domain-containing protein n=1 Tax=Paenibacillus chondroitinus TaxID=59842 RepID=A0ABU6DAW6_9BACL|nr:MULTISPECIES: helix-turn-helix domain-containing protein [Paenibacillus]MCY9656788.1 helix-turn-helix domain-containing protein [Paenibacillus anseongense]MEB4794437.1 helix-turn-helix domain-containing protein [Paenibacillus chondroitinus]
MRKTLFNRLLLSYMPIFIIVVTFTFFVFFQVLSEQSRKEALNANKMLSLQAMRLIDTSLKAIDNMVMMETINNKELADFFNNESKSNVFTNISAVKKMREMIASYPMIDSIYLVRFEDNFVLSNATSDQLSNYKDEPFIQSAKDPLGSKKWSGVRDFEQFSVKGSKPVVSLVRGAPFITGEKGMIVVNVATDSLRSSIADLYDPKTSYIGLRDAVGNELFRDSRSNEQTRIFSNYVSSYTGWSYQSGLVNGKVFHVISSLYNVWFIIGIAMIVVGFVWLLYVTRRNSKPLEQIVASIRGYRLPLSKEGGDEFSFIESALSNIIEQSNQYQQKHEEDRHLRARYLFHQLIEGDTGLTHEEWVEEISSLQLPYVSNRQVVLVIEMDKYSDFCCQYSRKDQNLLKFALRSVIQELAPKYELVLWAEWTSASQLSVMVFMGNEEEDGGSSILQLFDHVRVWAQENLKFTVTVGIGEQVVQLASVANSYKEALRALKYKIALGENRLITSEHIANHGQAEVFSHLNAIRSMIQSFRFLEDEWKTKYDELFGEMKLGLLTKDEITNLMNYLIYYLGREMAGMTKESQEMWMRDGLPGLSKVMDDCHSLEQMREESLDVLDSLYAGLLEAQDRRLHAATIRDMRKFIEEEYANPNMSLDYLSSTFNISSKYVSKLFKEETGQKFVDFLIDIRIQAAQRLLAESQAPMQEVAEQIGYTSAISFSRVFKKVMGCSPSEYREDAVRKETG